MSQNHTAPTPLAIRRVNSPLLHTEVAREIKRLIESGELAPGSRLSERQLGFQLGVSRTPLREALRTLAGEGLVELSPRRGALVARLDTDEVEHIFSVMEALEALAGALACEVMGDVEIDALRGLHTALLQSYKLRDAESFYALNRRIHEAILDGSHNPVLIRIYSTLNGQMKSARFMALNNARQWRDAVREHEEIMDALVHRDAERLGAALHRHLKNKRDKVKQSLGAPKQPRTASAK
jgi:DNA-binding GntR family transcriptional regulator